MSDDHSHRHPPQADHPQPVSHYEWLGVALNDLLIEKGLYTADELRDMIAEVEAVDPATHGARVVARAWTDAHYRARLLQDANSAVEELGFDSATTDLTVLENTPQVHNVVVCTLCSCYPRTLLGRPPTWYKSRPYRSRLVREPRAVLGEFGTQLPDDVAVRVHDSTAELRYLVLPLRPSGTDDWTEEQLAVLVTRDSMIGVTAARTP
jgi:nitrile hydratase subunit alpha